MTPTSWSAAQRNRRRAGLKKGSFLASLLLLWLPVSGSTFSAEELIQLARNKRLYESPTWSALTHSDNSKARIRKSAFLLTGNRYSLESELIETITLLYADGQPSDRQCQYPARNQWISAQLGIEPVSLQHCRELTEYLAKAPVDEVILVYASENLSQPSSIMGHILIKIAGDDAEGHRREHAVSFFTDVQGINIPKIVYDSLVVGKNGYFTLGPYEKKIATYLAAEQRNVWEYRLSLSGPERELLQLHIWELKNANPAYYFDAYNCATLTNYVLATANPALLERGSYLMSPLDVVRNVHQNGMIENVVVLPSNKWTIRMISETFPARTNRAIKASVDDMDANELPHMPSNEEQFLVRSLAETYNDYLTETNERTSEEWAAYTRQLTAQPVSDHEAYLIDVSQYKNPLKSPKDGQWQIGVARAGDENYLKAGLLPISHTLSEDNSQFFSETELRLADISILINDDDIELNELQLYSASSYLPRNRFTGGLSGAFRFGIEPHYNDQLERKLAGNVSGGLGATFEPVKQVSVFAMLTLGLGYRAGSAYIYTAPEVGVIVNEAMKMKTILSASQTFGQIDRHDSYTSINLRQSVRFNNTYAVTIDGTYFTSHGDENLEISAALKYLF
ncbi:MAG: DUF4105 domain-containing protein [Gammaproteobacteria bacterium]